MKLIQVNGWLGRLNGPLVRFIKAESPDIVCLQEALRPIGEDLPTFHDQYGYVKEIQAAADLPNLFFSPAWGFEMSGTTIDVGLAMMSKSGLIEKQHFHVNNSYYVAKQVSDYRRNTRAFQSASIRLGNSKLTLANYQGYLAGRHARGDEVSESLMKKVSDALSVLPRPLVFCGDLNVNPDTPTIAALNDLGLRNLITEAGIKSTLSRAHRAPLEDQDNVACDYIFVSQDIRVKNFQASDELVSDHKALVMEFDV